VPAAPEGSITVTIDLKSVLMLAMLTLIVVVILVLLHVI
jgi:hypothetical protein